MNAVSILVLKRNKVRGVPPAFWSVDTDNSPTMLTIQANLMSLGYMLDKEAFEYFKHVKTGLVDIFTDVVKTIKEKLGNDKVYRPMYNNFPQEVMAASDYQLFFNAICHYWSRGEWVPYSAPSDKTFAFEHKSFTQLSVGKPKDLFDVFTTLVSANGALTPGDNEIVGWFLKEFNILTLGKYLPDTIPFKEMSCKLFTHGLPIKMRTATDILRVAAYISVGTTDLSKPVKFKNFSRPLRKRLLSLIDSLPHEEQAVMEMATHRGAWVRLGERLHPGEYKNTFPTAFFVFNKLRNEKVRTFDGKVDVLLKENLFAALDILSTRPGVFARKLDHLLRTERPQAVTDAFRAVADRVSIPVLTQLYGHFKNRYKVGVTHKLFLPRKAEGKSFVLLKQLDPLPSSRVVFNIIENTLAKKLQVLDQKAFIDPSLFLTPIPFGMRSASDGLKTLIRGTRCKFDTDKTLRTFIHWSDKIGHIDLDLSAVFYSENMVQVAHVSYTNLRNQRLNACHSGDIIDRVGNNAEYVDIDVSKAKEHGVKFVGVQVHSYSNQPLNEIENCVFGWEERDYPESNLTYEPSLVKNAFTLNSPQKSILMAIVDIDRKEIIWADVSTSSGGLNNAESVKNFAYYSVLGIINAVNNRMTIGELLSLTYPKQLFNTDDPDVIRFEEDYRHEYDKVLARLS